MEDDIEFLASIPCPEDGRWARPFRDMYQGHRDPQQAPFRDLYRRFAELCKQTMRDGGHLFVNRSSVPHILPYGCTRCGAMEYTLDEHGLHHVAPCAFPEAQVGTPEQRATVDVPSGELMFVRRLEDLVPTAKIVPRHNIYDPFYWARLTEYAERLGVLVHAHHREDARIFRSIERPERLLIGNGKDTFSEYDGDFGATGEQPWIVAVDAAHYETLVQCLGRRPDEHVLLRRQLVPGRYRCTLRYPWWTRKMVTLSEEGTIYTSVFMRREGPAQATPSLEERLEQAYAFAQANTWITPVELDRRFQPLITTP